MNKAVKKVVVVGAGFAGLQLTRRLSRRPEFVVTLVDKRNFHLFQPLLYQVAMAGLSPAHIAIPVRSIFGRKENVRVVMDEVEEVQLDEKMVIGKELSYSYDYLAIATGTKNFYFNKPGWDEKTVGLKSLEEAREIRRRVLTCFERAESSASHQIEEQLTFVVIGGGPTGVELAGALGELSHYTLRKEFRNIDPRKTVIYLIEGGERILPSFHPTLSEKAHKTLSRLGVRILTKKRVIDVEDESVRLDDGLLIKSKTVIWAAGVTPQSPHFIPEIPRGPQGRIRVENDLSLPGRPEVFILGDLAYKEQDGVPLPGLAPVAIQQGKHAADVILADTLKLKRQPFRYYDKGQMATIGRRKAVLEMGPLRLHGTLAWWLWTFVHIFFLIGFRTRALVFIEWTWQYLRYRKGARII